MEKKVVNSLKKFYKTEFNTGFTLIEAVVAISILMIAIVSPLTISQKGLSSSISTKDEITAQFLAQDAIEYIKSIRNLNAYPVKGQSWLDGLENCISSDGESFCGIDTINPTVSSADQFLNFNKDLGTYSYISDSSYIPSKYKRKVSIRVDDSNDYQANYQALIKVTVSWSETEYVLSTYIFNFLY